MRIERFHDCGGHALRCIVSDHRQGWAFRQEEDAVVTREVIRTEWHRVERDLLQFDLRAEALRRQAN